MRAKFSLQILAMATLVGLMGCLDTGGGRQGRPLINKIGSTTNGGLCEAFYSLVDGSCNSACPTDTHVGSATEKTDAIAEIEGSNALNETAKEEILANINSASGVCIQGVGLLRPNKSVFVKTDYCLCLNGKPDSLNNCEAICAGKTANASTLFGSVTVGDAILTNSKLGNLKNWCEVELSPDYTNPGCVLEVTSDSGTEQLSMAIPAGSNSFSVNVSSLDYETPYLAKIVEANSGSNVSSDTFHIYRKKYPDSTTTPVGPLKIMPVSQYTCLTRSGSSDSSGNLFDNAARMHFYFPSNNTPGALAPGNDFLICHDVNLYGNNDSPLFPRLELVPQHFAVWDQSDIRFFDLDQDSKPDINKQIEERLLNEFGKTSTINIFTLFKWLNHPEVTAPPNVGFIMQPWVDPQTGRGFCPTQEHYNGNDPIFKILKEVVGVDTEGLFVSEKEPVMLQNSDGSLQEAPQDVLIIRESLLKKIWFYFENNQHFIPDDITATQKTIHFYWPPDVDDPYIRKSTQKIYTVRAPENLGKNEEVSGLNTTIKPPDKRFGCVPSLGNASGGGTL